MLHSSPSSHSEQRVYRRVSMSPRPDDHDIFLVSENAMTPPPRHSRKKSSFSRSPRPADHDIFHMSQPEHAATNGAAPDNVVSRMSKGIYEADGKLREKFSAMARRDGKSVSLHELQAGLSSLGVAVTISDLAPAFQQYSSSAGRMTYSDFVRMLSDNYSGS